MGAISETNKMSDLPGDLLYTAEHEWLRREDDGTVSIGVTDHAQSALGDLVYVELPEVGQDVKAASDVYSPIDGTVAAVNETLADDPETINSDPYGEGWIVKVQPSGDIDEGALMTPDAYQALLDEEEA